MNTEINYTSLIEKGLVKKSLSDTDIIPIGVYDKTKLGKRKQSGITAKSLKADILGNVTDVVKSVNTQTGDLELATINGTSLLQNTDITISSTVNYANVFFVDPVNGSNSTGEVNRFDKPYLTYASASTAALALAPTQTSPALVVLRKGTYVDNMLMKPYVYVYCEEGVVFTINGFYDDINTGVCKIYGHACFYTNGQPLQQNYGSDVYMEFDEAIQEATLFRGLIINWSTSYSPKTLVVCNKLESNCKNGYLITARTAADFTIHVKQWIKGPGQLINPKFLTGSMRVYCPNIISDNRTTPLSTLAKSCVWNQGSTSTAIIEIFGDLYNTSNNFSYSPGLGQQQSCVSSLQCSGGITRIYGNLYAGDTFGIYTVYASGADSMKYDIKGNISSKSIPICFLGNGNVLKIEGEITKLLNDAIAAPCIYAINSCEIYAKNVLFKNYNTVNSNIIALDTATTKGYFYNCTAYSTGSGDKFLKDASVGSIGCVNTQGSIPLGAVGATAAFSPQGYTQVTGTIVPNF